MGDSGDLLQDEARERERWEEFFTALRCGASDRFGRLCILEKGHDKTVPSGSGFIPGCDHHFVAVTA